MSNDLIKRFLDSKSYAWSEATRKNEEARLNKIASALTGNPEDLMTELADKASYTFVSIWNRAIEIWDLSDSQSNPYRFFKQKNARLFKNYYQRREVALDFDTAKSRIETIECEETRAKALDLLYTGMRYSESQEEKDGYIVGKGGKLRKVFRPSHTQSVIYSKSRSTFFRELKKLDLTAHMLRKLAATRLVNLGCKEQDLLKVMGWSSLDTARYYLQPKRDEELFGLMEAM